MPPTWCFFHLYQAWQLAPYLSTSDLATVIHATVTSRLDFCNSLYTELPLNLLRKLQLVQNAAAWVLTGTQWRAHITPVLAQLHWLQIGDRIRFKVLVLTFKAVRTLFRCPVMKGSQVDFRGCLFRWQLLARFQLPNSRSLCALH